MARSRTDTPPLPPSPMDATSMPVLLRHACHPLASLALHDGVNTSVTSHASTPTKSGLLHFCTLVCSSPWEKTDGKQRHSMLELHCGRAVRRVSPFLTACVFRELVGVLFTGNPRSTTRAILSSTSLDRSQPYGVGNRATLFSSFVCSPCVQLLFVITS